MTHLVAMRRAALRKLVRRDIIILIWRGIIMLVTFAWRNRVTSRGMRRLPIRSVGVGDIQPMHATVKRKRYLNELSL